MSITTILLIALAAIIVVLMIRTGTAARGPAGATSGHAHGENAPPQGETRSGHDEDRRHGCC